MNKLLVLILMLSQVFAIGYLQGNSMDPLLKDGEVFIRIKDPYSYREPRVGDIVTFPSQIYGLLSKQVIALEGDFVEIIDHKLYVNGQSTGLEGTLETSSGRLVPQGHIFVIGTTYNSYDSRAFGPITLDIITCRVVTRTRIILPGLTLQ